MKIGLRDLHPSVADILTARVWQMRMGRHVRPEDAGAHRVLARRWRGIGWRVVAAIPVGATVGAGIVALAGGDPGAMAGMSFLGAYLGAIGTGLGSLFAARFAPNPSVTAEELRALSTGLTLDRPDAIYLETVCALAEAGENISAADRRNILETLNDLLAQARYVDERLDRLKKAASAESTADLEKERARLAERLDRATDPQAQADLRQSLDMCDERLGNARELSPLIERLDAQREVIDQTLLSVQASASRLQIAPAAVSAPDVAEVKRIVSQVTDQTRAVEDAVQQVMALRS